MKVSNGNIKKFHVCYSHGQRVFRVSQCPPPHPKQNKKEAREDMKAVCEMNKRAN